MGERIGYLRVLEGNQTIFVLGVRFGDREIIVFSVVALSFKIDAGEGLT